MAINPDEIEKSILKRVERALMMNIFLRKDRDRQKITLLAGYPPPPELIFALSRLRLMEEKVERPRLKQIIHALVKDLESDLDLYTPAPVYVEGLIAKEGELEAGEREVIMPPE